MAKRATPKAKITKKPVVKKTAAKKSAARKPAATKTTTAKSNVTKLVTPKKTAKKTATKKPAAKRNAAKKADRDLEKAYTHKQFVAKLRRLADSIEKGKNFQIQVAGEKIHVPDAAIFNIEHERESGAEELEFQIKWKKAA